MTRTSKVIGTLAALTTMGAALVTLLPAQAEDNGQAGRAYVQTNLVSDIPGLAKVTDPNLKNPWGTSTAPGLPIWVSDNNAGVTTTRMVWPPSITGRDSPCRRMHRWS